MKKTFVGATIAALASAAGAGHAADLSQQSPGHSGLAR